MPLFKSDLHEGGDVSEVVIIFKGRSKRIFQAFEIRKKKKTRFSAEHLQN